jgi:dTMP kinase
MKGFFVTFEGIEGSGKTTQINLFANFLEKNNYDYLITREPGGTFIGDQIRAILLNPKNIKMDPITEIFLYTASRVQHLAELIKPALAAGKIVVCDRFIDSTLAYQGYGRGISINFIEELNRLILDGVEPDLTFLLDIPPEIGVPRARMVKNDSCSLNGDRIERENMDFHQRVRMGYLRIAAENPERIKIINGNRPADEINKLISAHFEEVYAKILTNK